MLLTEVSVFKTVFRWFFSLLDGIVYDLFGMLLKAYFGLANVEFAGPAINALKARIYIFVTIFMVFRVTISLLQAMVNPDVANDKKAGVGTVVSRVGISLLLLVAVPVLMDNILFGEINGRSNQEVIASIIPRLILGGSANDAMNNSDVQSNIGQHIASSALNSFFTIDEECGEGEEYKLDNMKVSSIVNHVNDKCETEHKTKFYKYEYSMGFSTICGVIMVIMLIGYSLDLVTRMLKLQILEILAPIPIIAYVDPGKGKDNLFSTWLKTLVSTYCEFFIKLATLYFVIFIMISFIQNKDAMIPDSVGLVEKGYMIVIVIIGLLLALQQLPQFISTLFGIKYQGMGAGLGTLLGAAAGFAAGGLTGALAGGASGMADGGKSGTMAAINKGKDAGKKTRRGQQISADREQRYRDKLAKKLGLSEAKDIAQQNLNNAEIEEARAKEELDAAQAKFDAAPENVKGEYYEDLAKARQNYANKKQFTADMREKYETASSNKSDPVKARAKGYGATKLESGARYVANHFGSKMSSAGRTVKDNIANTGFGQFVGDVAEKVSDTKVGKGISTFSGHVNETQQNIASTKKVSGETDNPEKVFPNKK